MSDVITITVEIPQWFEVFISIWIITYCLNYITSTDLYKIFKEGIKK